MKPKDRKGSVVILVCPVLIPVRFDQLDIIAGSEVRFTGRNESIWEFEGSGCKELNCDTPTIDLVSYDNMSISSTIRVSDGHAIRIAMHDIRQHFAIVGQHGRLDKNLQVVDEKVVVDRIESCCKTSDKHILEFLSRGNFIPYQCGGKNLVEPWISEVRVLS